MYTFLLLLIYAFFCLLVAYVGRDAVVGFLGVLLFSIFATPLLAAILILLLRPGDKRKEKTAWNDPNYR